MFEARIPLLEDLDFTICGAAVDDLGANAKKLRRSVAEKSLSGQAEPCGAIRRESSLPEVRDGDFVARRDFLLAAATTASATVVSGSIW
jgi:hypothetical protein